MIQLGLLSFKVGIQMVIRHNIQRGTRPMRDGRPQLLRASDGESRLPVNSDMCSIVNPLLERCYVYWILLPSSRLWLDRHVEGPMKA